jgi:hypothetical protein
MSEAPVINELARPGIGHNQPPLSTQLAEELEGDATRTDELVAAAQSSQIASDDDAAKVTTLIALIRNHEKKLDGDREVRKRPFLESCRVVDSAYAAVMRPLVIARTGDGRGGLAGMLTQWQRKREDEAAQERARIAAEQRRQEEEAARAREAAEAAKANGTGSVQAELAALAAEEEAQRLARQAETIRPEPIRTAVGAASMRREIAFDVTDLRKALGWLVKNRSNEISQAARTIVGKHLASLGVDAVERGVEIPGIAARIDRRAQVR